jgi:hypothetical protein
MREGKNLYESQCFDLNSPVHTCQRLAIVTGPMSHDFLLNLKNVVAPEQSGRLLCRRGSGDEVVATKPTRKGIHPADILAASRPPAGL